MNAFGTASMINSLPHHHQHQYQLKTEDSNTSKMAYFSLQDRSAAVPRPPNSTASSSSTMNIPAMIKATGSSSNDSQLQSTSPETTPGPTTQQQQQQEQADGQKRRRVKTGCLTCRKRHRKCGEQHPKCASCEQKGFECVWPAKTKTFVNNMQADYPAKGGHKKGNRIGDRILTTVQQERIPATIEPFEKQRSFSLGFLDTAESPAPSSAGGFNGSSNTYSSGAEMLTLPTKRSNSEFTGMADSPSGPFGFNPRSPAKAIKADQSASDTATAVKSTERTTISRSPPSASTTNALNKYSVHLQAISLAPYSTDNNSKMDLPSLLNGADYSGSNDMSPPPATGKSPGIQSHHSKSTATSGLSPKTLFKDNDATPNSLDDFFLNIETDTTMECNDYNDLHNILRDFMYLKNNNNKGIDEITAATPLNPDLFALPDDIRTFEDLIDANSQNSNEPFMSESERTYLLRNFIMIVAPTLDMFDAEKHFSRTVPRLALDCPALMYAALAYSAKQLERVDPNFPKGKAVQLYRYSLQQLIPTIKTSTIDLKIVCACLILCCLEMMSSSPLNWRRHLEGCFALFTSCDINGFSEDPFSKAMFWCFSRMDICSSIISEQPTIIPYKNWLPEGWSEYNLREKFVDPKYNSTDMYANYIVFLCSRVMNLLYNQEKDIDLKFDVEWERLWDELKEWELHRPADMLPILNYFDNTQASAYNSQRGASLSPADILQQQSPFPTVLFTSSQAISGNQMFHMAVILMMQNKPRLFKFPLLPTAGNKNCMIHRSAMSHARQIIAISVTNRDHGAWINSIQPFWVAGKLMGQENEQKLILQTIKEAEEATGWAIAWRGRDLVDYWNRNI